QVKDAALRSLTASDGPKPGVGDDVDVRPVFLADYVPALATRLGTRPPRRLPGLLVRLALGRYTAALLTSSFPTSSARFRSDFRWQPAYPTFAEGLDEVVAAWKAEGFPPGKGSHP